MTTNKTSYKYLALGLVLGVITIVTCQRAGAQTISKADSIAATRFIDSLEANTSIRVFKEWLFDKTTAKKFNEFADAYNFYLQERYNLWLQQKNKSKPK